MAAAKTIKNQLRGLGVTAGGVVLVHASMKALGRRVAGGPDAVIDALLAAVGRDGTLLMPALSYATVGPAQPRFDARETPACVGLLPEAFRRRPGVGRSVHPTHSVCGLGPRADEVLAEHAADRTPVGPRSPFAKLREVGGQVLMLGCGLGPNTSMHGVEELVEPPYLFRRAPVTFEVVDTAGRAARAEHRVHDFGGWAQRYDRVAALMPPGAVRVGKVLGATCHLLDARAMWDAGYAALTADPLAFVEEATTP